MEEAQVAADSQRGDAVRRRRVLYISGFDPRGPAGYDQLFAEESVRQSALNGASITVGPLRRMGPDASAWTVEANFDGQATSTDYRILRWDREVKRLWTPRGPRLLAEMWWVAMKSFSTGFIKHYRRRSWALCVALLLPVSLATLLQLASVVSALFLAWPAYLVAGALHAPSAIRWIAAAVMTVPPALVAIRVWRRFDDELRPTWLLRASGAAIGTVLGLRPTIEAAADRMAGQILDAAAEPGADEMLVIGHSNGAGVAVMALARAIRRDPTFGHRARPDLPNVALLTLGGAIAAWDYCASGRSFHDDLACLTTAAGIFWLDVAAPSDGAASARLDPVELIPDPAMRPTRRWPMFHQLIAEERYRRLRTRQFDFHFQYLRATETAGGYDFFRLVCGPDRLADFERGWTAFPGIPE
jgi:hypothetical protein